MKNKNKLRVSVLISGGGTNLQALIDDMRGNDHPAEIVQVISNWPDAYGLKRAEEAGIPTRVINHKDYSNRQTFDEALHEALVDSDTEFVCLAGFLRMLTAGFVHSWQDRMINIHPSLLPSFPGLNVHQKALDAGVRFAGCTVHFVRHEMDTGPIILQAAVPVLEGDDAKTLAARVLQSEHKIYPQALRWIAEGRLKIVDEKVFIDNVSSDAKSLIWPQEKTG